MAKEATVPAYRRNGKIPSCEPCRISKLRCDHEKPICQRCRQRRRQCSYHPAPMTKRAGAGLSSPSTPVQSSSSANTSECQPQPESRVSRPTEGYLGGTSFIASLAESQQGIDNGANIDPEMTSSYNAIFYDNNKVQQGVNVMKTLFPLGKFEDMFDQQRCVFAARTPFVLLRACWRSLQDIFEEIDRGDDKVASLRNLSRTLFENTAKPLPLPGNFSIQDYAKCLTGRSIRWETIGTICSSSALFKAARELCKRNALEELSKPPSWKALIDASNTCLSFCDELGSINDVVLWNLGENTILQTLFHGDASYPAWKRIGDISSCIFAMGLHQRITVSREVPRWLAEIRKANVMFAYAIDKMIAVFVGRPPRISRRYVVLEVPMSLNDDALALPPQELEEMIAGMGDDLWRYKNISNFPTLIYANDPLMVMREDVLELFLGTANCMNKLQLESHISGISQRSKEQWNNRPHELRYDPTIWGSSRPLDECYSLMMISLDHLYNDWLLQRVIVQRLHGDSRELLRLSDKMLSDGLAAVTQGGGDIGWNYIDLPWSIVLFCLPAAGVLVLELLRQSQTRNHDDKSFSRSRAIQNLSILISSLEWIVRPGIGNYELCRQARALLKRSLDRILDPSLMVKDKPNGSTQASNDQLAVQPSNNEADGFPTVDTPAELTEEEWLGISADPGLEFWSNLEDHSLMMFNPMDSFWPRSQGQVA